MDYRKFSSLRGDARAAFDAVEDWMAELFGERREELMAQLDNDEDFDAADFRPGLRYFGAGRARDRRLFASFLLDVGRPDAYEQQYREALEDVLRVAAGALQARSRHKLSFDHGVLYFTADDGGNLFGVAATCSYPMDDAFDVLEAIVRVYADLDVVAALNNSDPALWQDVRFRDDAFGVRGLVTDIWRRSQKTAPGRLDPAHGGTYNV
eukprot:TRINITY_DN93214_c0_g1_i1.p1 TRINITY_DN93214_c0_g1~~TRINITY_DN93214_c0_g1_i1.p1  ORF type:complete len:209 (-),score=42.72 TRINITY_DN93214_c0_g1_i1:74-700(-)